MSWHVELWAEASKGSYECNKILKMRKKEEPRYIGWKEKRVLICKEVMTDEIEAQIPDANRCWPAVPSHFPSISFF